MDLSLKYKLQILFTDYLIIIFLIFIIDTIFPYFDDNFPWLFWLVIYIIFYSFPEYIFRKTIGMKIWNTEISDNRNKNFKKKFLLYSILVFLDRYVFLVIHLASAGMLFDRKLLFSEKFSDLRWKKIKNGLERSA